MAVHSPQGKQSPANKLTDNRYFAALALVANVISFPIFAGLIAILLYTTIPIQLSGSEWWVVLLALAITFAIWLFLGLFFANSTTIEHTNRMSFNRLKNMLKELQHQLEIVRTRLNLEEATSSSGAGGLQTEEQAHTIPEYMKIALSQVEVALNNVEDMFGRRGLIWVSAEGYIAAWQEIHNAENALVMLLPKETVVQNAEYDLSRLQGSSIPQCPDLITRVQQAIDTLIATDSDSDSDTIETTSQNGGNSTLQTDLAQAMFALLKRSLVPSDRSQNEASIAADGDESQFVQDPQVKASFAQAMIDLVKNGINPTVPAPQQTELEARIDLSQIRSEINQYSDNRWAKLVRYRKNLLATAALTGVFTFVLLCIPILLKADIPTIIAATAIYLVGAIIGLFSRLNSEWGDNKTTVDDYGLTLARILVSPMLSGLAAVGGVLLVSLLALTLLSSSGAGGNGGTAGTSGPVAVSTLTSSGVTVQVSISQQVSNPQGFPTLGKIFNLEKNLTALIFAAVFGFLPSLLINLLQQQANNWQSQIQSNSQANQVTGGSGDDSGGGNTSSGNSASSGSNVSNAGSSSSSSGGTTKAVG
jgi:hypothetical protein